MVRLEPKYSNNRFYKKALKSALSLVKNPVKLMGLVDAVSKKAQKYKTTVLKELWHSLSASFRLVKAYAKNEYRKISGQNLLLIIAGMVYFLTPIDAIPDFIINFGLIDDAALLVWILNRVKLEIDTFIAWEEGKTAAAHKDAQVVTDDSTAENMQ